MNIFEKIWARIYQKVLYVVAAFLPWRKPYLLTGENSVLELPKLLKEKDIHPLLVVTSKDLISLGLLDGLYNKLAEEGVEYVVYDGTVPNPTIENIEEGYEIYKNNKCKGIVAFGGGSPIDCAKGIGAKVARPEKEIIKMKGLLKVHKPLPPLVAIPTTAGTGSEITLAAIITDSKKHEKHPINDPVLIPTFAVLDPQLTVGAPKHLTATTGIDALTHAVEAFIGKGNTKETKLMAKKAFKLIYDNLYAAYSKGDNIEARNNMLLASHYAGIAFTRAYVGYVHAIAHSLGGQYNTPHGLANSVILPYVLEYYGSSIYEKLAILADVVEITGINIKEKSERLIQWIKDLNASMGIPNQLEGIKEEDIDHMSKTAYKEAHPLYPVPKFMSLQSMQDIYRQISKLIIN